MISQVPKDLQENLFLKKYNSLEDNLKNVRKQLVEGMDKLLVETSLIKLDVFRDMKKTKNVKDYYGILKAMRESYKETKINPVIVELHLLGLQSFILESNIEHEEMSRDEQEKRFFGQISNLESLNRIMKMKEIKQLILNDLYLLITCLELYTKKTIIDKKHQIMTQIDILFELVQHTSKKYPIAISLCKKLLMIYIHLKIHAFSIQQHQDHSQSLNWFIENVCLKLTSVQSLLTYDIIVVMLYNTIKILLGLERISPSTQSLLHKLYSIFELRDPEDKYYFHIIQIFFIIKIIIFREGIIEEKANEQMQDDKMQASELYQKFSVFLNTNLDETVVELSEINRNIIRHKVASLSTLIGLKLGIDRFSKDFLQIMHDSPYNNDIQTIKLCFQLFEFRQFQKLQYLLQNVLSVPATKSLKQRECLVAMCAIFTGLYKQNREQGLLYTKLNHQTHISCAKQGKERKEILKEQTLLQHVGFGYYNLAQHEPYIEKRTIFLMKALENLKKSHTLNEQNYLLNYCIGKIYLQIHDYNNAYKYSIQACKSHRGSWAPFCLLACIYMCQRKVLKSLKLIEELLKKYNDIGILYYVRAYIQVNKILLEVETDQEIESAKILGEQYYLVHYQKLLKNKAKSISQVMNYCRIYYQLSMEQDNIEDQNFFSQTNNFTVEIGKGQQYLFPLFKLFLDLDQINIVEGLLKIMPQNNVNALYFKALIHEKRKQSAFAANQLKVALEIDPFNPQTLIKLSLLQVQQEPDQALYYLQLAGKYLNSNDYNFAKGMLLSKLGKIKEANQMFLIDADTAWCQYLPDLLYYY